MAAQYIEKVIILDFGSQYTQLIARRIREHKVYCEIHPYFTSISVLKDESVKGIVLSGGPASVYGTNAPRISKSVFGLGKPVLGICYGFQLMSLLLGGRVSRAKKHEYGHAEIRVKDNGDLLKGLPKRSFKGWMSHGDCVARPPKGFVKIATTSNAPYAAAKHAQKNLYGVQFHPEVVHTDHGSKILANFLFEVCRCRGQWSMQSFVKTTIKDIREKVGKKKVICGVSGGVDSLVASVLLHKAIGSQLICLFVNNGVLRKDEARKVIHLYRKRLKIKLTYVNASKNFLQKLKGIRDPEKKRKIIGREFIRVFEREVKKLKEVDFLAQGTLYPDVIESVSVKGPSATIKSHHNVGGLPKRMRLKLVEPLRELFKDEVRTLGKAMGLPKDVLWRQPFPGPGLAVRILGEVTQERLDVLREADHVVVDEIKKAGLYHDIWQAFAVLLPVKSVGVMGDERTYEDTCVIRAVHSSDGMTADWVKLPYALLNRMSNRLINEVRGINRVVYDISSKPPSTIEWE